MNTRPLLSHFLKQSETAERYTSTVSLKPSTPVARDHSDPLDVDLEGLLSQAPIDNKVEKGPDRRDMSPLGTIRRLEYTINKQKESIDDMKVEAAELNVILGTNIRLRKILTSISFVTWAIIAWVGVSFYGQISPVSSVQASMSGVARKFSSSKTWYEIAVEESSRAIDIQKRNSEINKLTTTNETLNKIVSMQQELLGTQKKMIDDSQKEVSNMSEGAKKVSR